VRARVRVRVCGLLNIARQTPQNAVFWTPNNCTALLHLDEGVERLGSHNNGQAGGALGLDNEAGLGQNGLALDQRRCNLDCSREACVSAQSTSSRRNSAYMGI
jgi:hypothetical protein